MLHNIEEILLLTMLFCWSWFVCTDGATLSAIFYFKPAKSPTAPLKNYARATPGKSPVYILAKFTLKILIKSPSGK